MNTTTKTLWANVNGVWTDLHIRAFYDSIPVWVDGNFGISVDNGTHNSVPANPSYGAFAVSGNNLVWNLPASQSVSAGTLTSTNTINFASYSKIKMKYTNGNTTGVLELNISSFADSAFLFVCVDRNGSNCNLRLGLSNTKDNFASSGNILAQYHNYVAMNTGSSVTISEIIIE